MVVMIRLFGFYLKERFYGEKDFVTRGFVFRKGVNYHGNL